MENISETETLPQKTFLTKTKFVWLCILVPDEIFGWKLKHELMTKMIASAHNIPFWKKNLKIIPAVHWTHHGTSIDKIFVVFLAVALEDDFSPVLNFA